MDAGFLMADEGWETLVQFAQGSLSPAAEESVRRLVSEVPAVADRLARVEGLLATLERAGAEAPAWQVSPAQIERLQALRPTPRPSWLEEIIGEAKEAIASLVLDSRGRSVLAGFRGRQAARRLIFATPAAEVEMRLSPEGASLAVVGHVSDTTARLAWFRDTKTGAETQFDVRPDGMFEGRLAAGLYEVIILTASEPIVIPSVDGVGESSA